MKIKNHLEENREKYSRWINDNDQGMVEYKILPYLQGIEDGFFIEAGANDGLFQSTTKILEDLGWSGLLVEPSEKAYLECLQSRKCFIENCALVSFDYTEDFVFGDFWEKSPRARVVNSPGFRKVNAKTLTSLLNDINVSHVDFLSLDVEGYEMQVLGGIDFDKIDISYMLIEVNSDFYTLEQMNSYLLERGFKNILNVSNFTPYNTVGWPGNHQDYLYKNINVGDNN